MKKTTSKSYDSKVSWMVLYKFFNLIQDMIIEQEWKKWWVSHCTNIRLTHGLNGTTYDKNGKLISQKKNVQIKK